MNQKQPLVQAFINIHTALRNDLKPLDNTVQRKGKLSNRDLEGLQRWFNFYWEHDEIKKNAPWLLKFCTTTSG